MTTEQSFKSILHIGFDDTDSTNGRCTTHLAFKIVSHLLKKNDDTAFIDYPLLIRLNPNIPWKTRGNGAVCLRIATNNVEEKIDFIKEIIRKDSFIGEGANPAVAFFEGCTIPNGIKNLSNTAMYDIISIQEAENVAIKNKIIFSKFGNGQGLVGAIAAIGNSLNEDHTFEVIAYRREENLGSKRIVDEAKVIMIDKHTRPYTFNNYDYQHKRVLIAPHGPDPVFCGIRGENPHVLIDSFNNLQIEEKLDGYMIYRTNQGTNMHLANPLDLSNLRVHTSGYLKCYVSTKPHILQGGHTLFYVNNSLETKNERCLVAVYEPTGLTKIASQLEIGDLIQIGCGVRESNEVYPKTLNVEYLSVLNVTNIYDPINPICKICNKRMKSEGKDKGYQCEKCGYKNRNGNKIKILRKRNLNVGLFLSTPKAHRHLTKPLHRYGLEKKLNNDNEILNTNGKKLLLSTNWFRSDL